VSLCRQRFGEDVGRHLLSWDVLDLDSTLLDHFEDPFEPYIDVP